MDKNHIKTEAMLEHLLLQEAISIEGFDPKTGETTYSINEKLKDVSPEIYYQMKIEFEDYMFTLIEQGPMIMQWKVRLQ